MSDRFPAQIWIGGQVSRTKRLYPDDPDDDTTILQGLVESLNADGASHEYGDAEIDSNCTDWDNLALYLDSESLLNLKQDQAVMGEFPATEQFCIDNGIAFDRDSDHYCEYDAEMVHWRPGMDDVETKFVNSSGRENVDGETVRLALAKIVSYQQTCTHVDGERDEKLLEAAEKLLKNICPELPPDLEPFGII